MDSPSINKFINAPIFRPNEEEFKNGPANYLRKISKNHPNIPCCIIAPPQSFNPYFSLDQDTFKFKTIKQNFLTNHDVPAEKEFTFREYHRMGDSFKCDYFGKPPNKVPSDEIDENFWTLVTQGEDVHIFSAYHLSTKVFGSGFPNRDSGSFLTKDDEKYLDHPWNLQNVPESEDNIFSFLGNQLKDNIVPSLEIGMCFSHRGWRRDIHWSYSINYLHCGDSKIFYAVSPDENQYFESEFNSGSVPLPTELIGETTTICNSPPTTPKATNRKIKVFKAELHPGHFLVTFPSVYYMNYDSGVNVVESVVIAPVSWIPIGHKAIEYLCDNKQPPLFSHEETISKLAIDGENFGIETLNEISTNLELMIYQELSLREVIDNYPTPIKYQRQAFELIPEDSRRCSYCGFIIFFSALICCCEANRFLCLKHIDHICKKCPPSNTIFRYRYNKEEFEQIVYEIKVKISNFENWKKKVNTLLFDWSEQAPITILRDLYDTAEERIYPQDCREHEKLCNTLQEFEQVHKIVQELLDQQNKFIEEENSKRVKQQSSLAQSSARIKKKMESEKDENKHGNNPAKSKLIITRNSESDNENRKLSVFEFSGFCEVLDTYPFVVPGSDELRKLLFRCIEIDKLIESYLDENTSLKIDSKTLANLIHDANTISFICFERKLDSLKDKLIQVKWLEDCDPILDHDKEDTNYEPHNLNDLKSLIESGLNLKTSSNLVASYLNRLNMIYGEGIHWLDSAKNILNTVKQNSSIPNDEVNLDQVQRLLVQSRENPGLRAVDLSPVLSELEQLFTKCEEWLNNADVIMASLRSDKQKNEENIPYAFELEDLYNKGKNIGIHFGVLGVMKASLQVVNDWKEKVNKTFLRRNSFYPIVNVLAPRSNYSLPSSIDIMNCSSRSIYQQLKKFATQIQTREGSKKLTGFEKQLASDYSVSKIRKIYDLSEKDELAEIQIIRGKNIKKNNQIAFNEFNPEDDAGEGDLNEKDKKSKERDRNPRKFCFCGKPAGEWMVQCQLCQEWYHISCVSSYLPFVNLVSKGRKQLIIQNSDDIVDQFNFVCILCCRGKRPSIDLIQELICSYTKLPTRVLEGELLICLLKRIQRYQEKVKNRIDSHSELSEGFEIVEKNYCLNSDSSSQEQNITGSPSKNKRKSPLILRKDLTDNPGLKLSNESRAVLLELVCEGNLLEASVSEVQHLWNIMLIVNSNLKTLVFVNPNSTSLAILASSTFMISTNKRSPESDECNEGEAVESSDATKSKNKKRRRDRSVFDRSKGKKNRKGKSDKDNNEPEPELCSLNSECLRPEGQEVDWIFCEGRCQGWFHQLCAGISNPQEVVHLEKYICATCQSLDEVESSTRTENGSRDSNLKKTSKAGKASKNDAKPHVPASTDETSMTPKVFEDNCERRRDNTTSDFSKNTNLVIDDNAIEMDQINENNLNGDLDLRDVPRIMADDEETTSVLSEDRVYHETSFESIEESIVENDTNNVSQVYNTYVNNNVLANVQSSSQTEAVLQSDQSLVIEEIPSLTEPIVSIVRRFENGTKDNKKGCNEPEEMSHKILICDVTELKSNCSSQREKQVTVGNSETSVHNRQLANQITNPKES